MTWWEDDPASSALQVLSTRSHQPIGMPPFGGESPLISHSRLELPLFPPLNICADKGP